MSGDSPARTGRCLCGAVAYEIHGPLREVLLCHCEECRRWHGHFSAFTATTREALVLREEQGLRWTDSPNSDARARRGFCGECGSSLFWDPPDRPMICVAAGTLDDSRGLRAASHWYVTQVGDYYELADDGLPRHARGGDEL